MKPEAIIVDMDGTLANVSGIRHYVKKPINEKDFDAFHKASIFMPPNPEVVQMVEEAHEAGRDIFVVTARKAMWERSTRQWLSKYEIHYDALCMRPTRDQRPDFKVKKDILDRIRETHDVVLAIDDNPSVIELWTSENIPTYTVPGWEVE